MADSQGPRTRKHEGIRAIKANAVPGFIHVHSPISIRHSREIIQTLLERGSSQGSENGSFLYVYLDGIQCFSSRLFYYRILEILLNQCNSNSEHEGPIPLEDLKQYTFDLSNFIRALRLISHKCNASIIIVIERVEKFKESLPELWTPLSRLNELARIPLSVITISRASWFELRPLDGSAIDPLLINVNPYNKQDSQTYLINLFPSRLDSTLSPYNPSFKPLYSHFIATLINICTVFLVDEIELGYIASACWPIFVQPILNQWRLQMEQSDNPQLTLPDEDARIRLTKYFSPLISHALEMLYPRTQHITEFVRENKLPEDIYLSDILQTSSIFQIKNKDISTSHSRTHGGRDVPVPPHIQALTTIAKYILVAAFLASHNPPKSDLKLFGRSSNEKGRRKKGGGTVKSRAVSRGKAKVPQRLLGPITFPLDRLVAIVGSIMEEYYEEQKNTESVQSDDENGDDDVNAKDIEMVVRKVQVLATITELVNQGLLDRIASEKAELDTMTYKCTINQTCAFALARELGIESLKDYMYDAEE
ncbi:hypothetical protein Clacol_009355 [Clathrus columnatus]|uniref:Origin recognition complex subunit 5 C-terminal domain-containing protein n=1 Tax=Clathrus columnatus TaxID=1419009 RepID=A0AAV5AQJ6_9AGAM|nr:hypothetical protein Clacol_009355 [Clathrus columnatus]